MDTSCPGSIYWVVYPFLMIFSHFCHLSIPCVHGSFLGFTIHWSLCAITKTLLITVTLHYVLMHGEILFFIQSVHLLSFFFLEYRLYSVVFTVQQSESAHLCLLTSEFSPFISL